MYSQAQSLLKENYQIKCGCAAQNTILRLIADWYVLRNNAEPHGREQKLRNNAM